MGPKTSEHLQRYHIYFPELTNLSTLWKMIELDRAKRLLEDTQQENQQMSQLIDLNSHIERMKQYIEDQRIELEELKRQLQASRENMIAMRDLYKKELESKNVLTEQCSRFSLDNLMVYSPREWLDSCNKVVVKFVETLVQINYASNILSPEKLFKAAVAVNTIYGAWHEKYISEIHLANAAIKYTVVRSKLVINIDNHITSCGSYNRFLKWQDKLSKQEEPLLKVTSFAAFNMSLENKIQHTNSSWVYDSLNMSQFDELFCISAQMQEVINEELHSYLAEVLQLLFEEKLLSTNPINSLVESASTNIAKMKTCPGCNKQDIENQKRKCPSCKTQLPTLAEIQKEKVTEIANDLTIQLTNHLIFKPYKINHELFPLIPHTKFFKNSDL
ncbi:hypothetical protein C2G38_2200070 [Gigaspora rosea]|uniref:Uncharacterized protein n=1 Tax=Gigaspora rosea TaxID=44941 RepID=A0A397UVB3_9GLOM|nr:hypothetical protein C2G38_2200070 [Gigaspora rosea]